MTYTKMNAYETLNQNFNYFFKGDKYAVSLCLDLWLLTQVWDDLVDRDKEVSNEDISGAFRIALISIPRNPFYQKYFDELNPTIISMIMQWQDANVLEKGSQDDIAKAYMLRAGIYQVFHYCAYIIGGDEWVKEIGPQLRRSYGEKFLDFYKEMKNA